MGHEWRIFQAFRLARNKKFLGRHRLHCNLAALLRALDRDVMQVRNGLRLYPLDHALQLHHGLRIALNLRELGLSLLEGLRLLLFGLFVWIRLMGNRLDFLIIEDFRKLDIRQAAVIFLGLFRPRVPPAFDDARFGNERILEGSLEDSMAVVLLVENVIQILGRILGGLLVLWLGFFQFHHTFRARELRHKLGKHGFDDVANLCGDDR